MANPTLSNPASSRDGATVTATLSVSGCTPVSGAAGFTLGGTTATVASWSISGTTLTLVLSGYLGELPDKNAEPVLRELLAANLYGDRTAGATLGLQEDTGGVILCLAQSVDQLDRQGFETLVEDVLDQAEKWRGRLIRRGPDEPEGTAAGVNMTRPMIFG